MKFTLEPCIIEAIPGVATAGGFELLLNGKLLGITQCHSLEALASRPTCHEMQCSGCIEGWAAEIAHIKLVDQERKDEIEGALDVLEKYGFYNIADACNYIYPIDPVE